MDMGRDDLEATFGSEGNYAVGYDGPEERSVFPDGSDWAICTNWARYVRRVLGDRAEIHGFFEDANPGSQIAATCGGHDFAVVDGRWIVDGWVRNVECMSERAVFDLMSEDDMDLVGRLYGDPSTWTRCASLEEACDGEGPERRAEAMAGTDLALAPAVVRSLALA